MGIEVAKTALYNFMRDKCRISLNKAHFHSVDRNAPEKLGQQIQLGDQMDADRYGLFKPLCIYRPGCFSYQYEKNGSLVQGR